MTAPATAADAAREAAAREAALFYGRCCPEVGPASHTGPADPSRLRELIDAINPAPARGPRVPTLRPESARRAPRTTPDVPTVTAGVCETAECTHPMRIHDIAGCRRAGCACAVSAVA